MKKLIDLNYYTKCIIEYYFFGKYKINNSDLENYYRFSLKNRNEYRINNFIGIYAKAFIAKQITKDFN
jgi:hypothetical protein